MDTETLLNDATDFYLKSKDFNGYPCHHIFRSFGLGAEELRLLLKTLVEAKRIALVFGDRHSNPHIRAFSDEPVENQLEKLETVALDHVYLYSTPEHLLEIVDGRDYEGRPYTLKLALGEGELEFRAFDLSVLEVYRNDPRYYYTNDDIRGNICISDEYY